MRGKRATNKCTDVIFRAALNAEGTRKWSSASAEKHILCGYMLRRAVFTPVRNTLPTLARGRSDITARVIVRERRSFSRARQRNGDILIRSNKAAEGRRSGENVNRGTALKQRLPLGRGPKGRNKMPGNASGATELGLPQ